MNTWCSILFPQCPGCRAARPVLAGAILLWFLGLGLAPQAAAGSSEIMTAATNAAPAVPVIPQSVFVVDPQSAIDPFFPKTKGGAPSTPPPPSVEFKLRAIMGSANRRVALINNKDFEVGEEGFVSAGASKVKVRCLAIREQSVTILVEGKERKELRLP